MDKRITFGYTETEKFNFHHRKNLFIYLFILFLKFLISITYRYLAWFLLVKKIINVLLVTKMVIIKSNHYA